MSHHIPLEPVETPSDCKHKVGALRAAKLRFLTSPRYTAPKPFRRRKRIHARRNRGESVPSHGYDTALRPSPCRVESLFGSMRDRTGQERKNRENRCTIVERRLKEVVRRHLLPEPYPRASVRSLSKLACAIPELLCLLTPVLHGGRFNFFRGYGGEAVSPIIGDRSIDDRSAVDTFPGIEGQKKVRESFQHHQSFALRTIHNYFLPRDVNELVRGSSNLRSRMTASQYQRLSTVGTTYTYNSVRSVVSFFNSVRHFDFGENEDGMTSKMRIGIHRGVILTPLGLSPAT